MKVSSELASQTINKHFIASMLIMNEREKWTKNYNTHELVIEPWAVALWVKQEGLVSYNLLANQLYYEAELKAAFLDVEKFNQGTFIVTSYQDKRKKYTVTYDKINGWRCNCMRYKCWANRMPEEWPQLYEKLGKKVFCHHIAAAYKFATST